MKATELLEKQHRAAETIFAELEKGKRTTAPERVKKLVASLSAHMVIEQEMFYPAVKAIKPDLVKESFEEHAGAQYIMERLLATEPDDENFPARVTTLKEMIQHHVEEEEKDLFPKVEKQMEPAELNALGVRMKAHFEKLMGGDLRSALNLAEETQPMPVEFN